MKKKKNMTLGKKGVFQLFSSPTTFALTILLVFAGFMTYVLWDDIDAKFRGVSSGLEIQPVSETTSIATPDTPSPRTFGDCNLATVAWTPIVREKYNPQVTAGDTFGYKINGVEISTTNYPTTAINVQPFASVEMITGTNASATTWASVKDTFEVPCVNFQTLTDVPDVTSSQLTFKIKNSYDDLINSASQPDQLTTGVKDITLTIDNTFEDDWGVNDNGLGMLVCAEYNNTGSWEEVVPSSGVVATKPQRLSTASGSVEDCYEYEALQSNSNTYSVKWSLDTDDDYFFAGQDNITFTAVAKTGFRSDKLMYEYGYETDKKATTLGQPTDETATYYVIPTA